MTDSEQKEITNMSSEYQAQANELSQKLWAIANDLRGNMDASKFKNYILGTIFYDYLSTRTEIYMQEILKDDGLTYEEAFESDEFRPIVEQWSIEHLGYIIQPKNLYRELVRKINKPENDEDKFSIADYERAINDLTGSTLGQPSEPDFTGLFNDMKLQDPDLGDTVAERTALISKVIVRVGEIDLGLADKQFDVLGTAYMILIGLFASDAGKKSGEFFTPAGPSKLVATLATVGLDEAKTVGDCTCGSASMLLEVQKHLTTGRVGHFYGQENNASTYNLARMNMLMHGIDYQNFDIYKGDTITDDKYGDVKMTVQVCNPPYSLKYSAEPRLLDDPRFSGAGKLPPKSHADFAFVEHMIYHMDENDGRVAVLLPHGVLFRGTAEETIRKYIIKELNVLDAVIGLPPNLFHGTSIPVCLLILKSQRNGDSNNVFFIDASKEFTKGKKNNVLEDKHIDKIVDAYVNREDIPKFAHKASMDEIIENDYNLNIPRYVDTFEEEEPVDLAVLLSDMKETESKIAESSKDLAGMMRDLTSDDEKIMASLNDCIKMIER
jgi:type I restriction enzyme M protein